MWWLFITGALLLVLMIPVGIKATYNNHGAAVDLFIGPVRIALYPGKKTKKSKQKRSKNGFDETKRVKKHAVGDLAEFLSIARLILDFLKDFRRKLRINRLEIVIILAGGDPCDLSVDYGRACAALGSLMPCIEQLFIINRRRIEVECDFVAEKTVVDAGVDMRISVARVISLFGYHGFRVFRKYFNIMKKSKAVQ